MVDPIPIPGFSLGSILVNFASIVFWLLLIAMVLGVLFVLWRFLSYKHVVEVWEKKGDEITFFGDDSVKRDDKRGVAYMSFLRGKGFTFKNVKFPDAEYIYPKKVLGIVGFGTKMKLLLVNDELVPFKMRLGNPHGLVIDSMPSYQKQDFIQRYRAYEEKYKPDNSLALKIQLASIGLLVLAIIIVSFFSWQQNVEASNAIAGGLDSLGGIIKEANTLPVAPG